MADSAKFFITLDAIDLNFIPTTHKQYDGNKVTQIWTTENLNLRDNNYYEFEIKQDDIKNRELPNTFTYENVVCHICNIQVPKPFLKEHFDSKKHKMCETIIDISLTRSRMAVLESSIIEESNTCDSVYFCPCCVEVVDIKQKSAHEKLLSHKNSINMDNIFELFLNLYNCDIIQNETNNIYKHNISEIYKMEKESRLDNKIDCGVSLNSNNLKDTVANTMTDKNDAVIINNNSQSVARTVTPYANELNSIENHNIKDNKEFIFNDDITVVPSTSGFNVDRNSDTSPEINKKDYTMNIDNKRGSVNLSNISIPNNTVLLQKPVEIITVMGTKMQIKNANYNGLKLKKKRIKCILCKKKIVDLDAHLNDVEHLCNIRGMFIDENCIRQINNEYHCALCNIVTLAPDKHIDHCNHIRKVLTAMENYDQTMENLNVSREANAASNKKMKQCTNDTQVSVRQADNVVKTKYVQKALVEYTAVIKDYFIKDDSFICNACTKKVPNHNFNIYSHLRDKQHIANVSLTRSEHMFIVHYHMDLTQLPTIICMMCSTAFLENEEEEMTAHVRTEHHKDRYDRFITVNNIIEADNKYFCNSCSCDVPLLAEVVHCQTNKHIRKLKEYNLKLKN